MTDYPSEITVFYDGACGLCVREIAFYRRIAPEGKFAWRDLSREPEALAEFGVTRAGALKSLHVTDGSGKLHEGVAAFLQIWRGLGGVWRVPAILVSAPGARWLAERAYRAFATWRFARLEHCQLAAAEEFRPARQSAAHSQRR